MVFSEAQIAQCREQGYVAVPHFWRVREAAARQGETGRGRPGGEAALGGFTSASA